MEVAAAQRRAREVVREKQRAEEADRQARIAADRAERDRLAALPAMAVAELASYLKGELEENVTHRLVAVTGKDFAAALELAGKPQGEMKTVGMFGRHKTIRKAGWTIGYLSTGYSDPDSWYGTAAPPVRLRHSGHAYVGHLEFDLKRVYRAPDYKWEPDVIRAYRSGNKKSFTGK